MRDGRPTDIDWRSVRLRAAGPYGNMLYELILLREPAEGQATWFVWTLDNNFRPANKLDNPAEYPAANQVVRIDEGALY